ncbi:MAG: M20/M25/M40 family metallo-hydrolase [Elusimicrobia bacterium]|nr:M20/M25/M40 family metallo-hydrolase [Elusimicrobiota bacterium]
MMVFFLFFTGMVLITQSMASAELEKNLKEHVYHLAGKIGERNFLHYEKLEAAADYISNEFKTYGYQPECQFYTVTRKKYRNIIAEKKGNNDIIIIGAHYDSVVGSPGADDNASAVAGLLELSRILKDKNTKKTIRFAAFTNEEPPFFYTEEMGSRVYAKEVSIKKENVRAMICLEMIGYYTEKKKSQEYPLGILKLFYPSKGNFIGFVSNMESIALLNKAKALFKKHSKFPMETLTAPTVLSAISLSDHSSFWKYGYKAIMVTDSSYYRNANYHTKHDTPDTLDYKSMTQVVEGLAKVIEDFAKK